MGESLRFAWQSTNSIRRACENIARSFHAANPSEVEGDIIQTTNVAGIQNSNISSKKDEIGLIDNIGALYSNKVTGTYLIRKAFLQCRHQNLLLPVLLECGQLIWWYDALFAARLFTNTYPKLRPWHVLRIIVASFGPLTNSPEDIGIRLRVWWAGNNKYFEGTIVSFRYSEITAHLCLRGYHTTHAIHTVRYDDGDLREYDLSTKIYEIIVDQHVKKSYSCSLQKHLEIVSSTPTHLVMDPKKKWLSKRGRSRSNRVDPVEEGTFAVSWALLSLHQIYLHHLLNIKWENNHDISTPLHFAEEECITKVHEKKKEHTDDGFCQKKIRGTNFKNTSS